MTDHEGSRHDSSDLESLGSQLLNSSSQDTRKLKLGHGSEVVDHQHDLVGPIIRKRHKRPILIRRRGQQCQHILDQRRRRCQRDNVQPGLVVDPHPQLELVNLQPRLLRSGAGDMAVLESGSDRGDPFRGVLCDRVDVVDGSSLSGESTGDLEDEHGSGQTPSTDHLSLGATDRDIVPDSEQSDVGVRVLGKVLLLGESKVEHVAGVCEREREQADA